jgi:hypothetical protein
VTIVVLPLQVSPSKLLRRSDRMAFCLSASCIKYATLAINCTTVILEQLKQNESLPYFPKVGQKYSGL